ncbi:MAG: hypothetical protein D3908_00355, partial [Candidatus Electrothrix sp. AUS4]|nr:hypothetical protein [Candidatus Electrothrix sp. AUS4]
VWGFGDNRGNAAHQFRQAVLVFAGDTEEAVVPNTPLFGMEISKSWLAIRTELEEVTEAKNYIDRDQ